MRSLILSVLFFAALTTVLADRVQTIGGSRQIKLDNKPFKNTKQNTNPQSNVVATPEPSMLEFDPKSEAAAEREWTSKSGTKITASLASCDTRNVILTRPDGVKMKVSVDALSDPDFAFVKSNYDKQVASLLSSDEVRKALSGWQPGMPLAINDPNENAFVRSYMDGQYNNTRRLCNTASGANTLCEQLNMAGKVSLDSMREAAGQAQGEVSYVGKFQVGRWVYSYDKNIDKFVVYQE